MKKFINTFILILFTAAVVFAVQGGASAEAMAAPARGEGRGAISGYTVTNLEFQLGQDPTQIKAVAFELDDPARETWVSFDTTGPFFPCQNLAGTRWVCEVEGVETGEVKEIQVSAGE